MNLRCYGNSLLFIQINLFIVPAINYFSLSLCFLCAVQLCGSHPGSTRNDSQTAGAGNGLQDHGARQGIDEGQEEGELLVLCLFKSRSRGSFIYCIAIISGRHHMIVCLYKQKFNQPESLNLQHRSSGNPK